MLAPVLPLFSHIIVSVISGPLHCTYILLSLANRWLLRVSIFYRNIETFPLLLDLVIVVFLLHLPPLFEEDSLLPTLTQHSLQPFNDGISHGRGSTNIAYCVFGSCAVIPIANRRL